jgi:hypothetical protein
MQMQEDHRHLLLMPWPPCQITACIQHQLYCATIQLPLLLPSQHRNAQLTMRVRGSSACSTVALSLLSPALTRAAAAFALLTFSVLATPADSL